MGEPEEDTEVHVVEDDLGQMLREAEEVWETEKESRDLNRMLEDYRTLYRKICVHYIISIILFRQEIQRSRKHGCHHQIGLMSPLLVNQKMLNENYKDTCQNMYDSLTRQNYKSYIFIPYNFG